MTIEKDAENAFRMLMVDLAHLQVVPGSSPWKELTAKLSHTLLNFASHSEDNLSCVNELDIGEFSQVDGTVSAGVKVHAIGRMVSNVLWHAEGCSVPEQVTEAIPELTQPQWDACLRFVTLMLSAFEAHRSDLNDSQMRDSD